MQPRIQYARTSDGVSIAYTEQGAGRPLITMPVAAFSHAELSPQMYSPIFAPLASRYHLITYDSRGSGMSDRDAVDFSMEAMLRDLDAIVERTGVESFVLAAWITGAPIAVTYAVAHPERVSHLVLSDGWASFSDFSDSTAYKAGAPLLEGDWTVFTETFAQVLWAYENPEYGRAFAQFIRACCEPEAMRAAWAAWRTYDATEYLPQVKAPTLVVQNKNSRWFGLEIGRRLAASIPNARLSLIDDITYGPVAELINEFVGEEDKQEPKPGAAPQRGGFRTVLFTDLVGHTEMMSRLGDEAGRQVLREHERVTRDVLAANEGTEVKTMGDGFLASFGSITKAVECAIALQRAFAERNETAAEPLRVRVGLNAGEPIEDEGDLFGATVILAARIAAQAAGDEILASDVVRGLCSGKGFLFADRGEQALRGFEDPVRIFEISWRG